MTRVKICGCMRPADAIAAAEAGADFIGIMLAESRRRVAIDEAVQIARTIGEPLREIEQDAPSRRARTNGDTGAEAWFARGADALDRLLARKRPLVVGVFENQPIEEVNEISEEVGLDLIQLSGDEPWSDCLAANRQVVKAIRTRASAALDHLLARIEPDASLAVMIDDSRGSGIRSDWSLAGEVAARMPIWLAGGLTPANVTAAIEQTHPWAVDVSTGVETDGAKDAQKISDFVAAAKGVRV